MDFEKFLRDLPNEVEKTKSKVTYEVSVSNLPNVKDSLLKKDLEKLASNSGGKVKDITEGNATIKYSTPDAAVRGASRINAEKIKGRSLTAILKYDDYNNQASSSTSAPQNLSEKEEKCKELVLQIKNIFKNVTDIPLSSLQRFYTLKYGHNINVRPAGYNHVYELLKAHTLIFKISGKKKKTNEQYI